jgi:hypothetical protein
MWACILHESLAFLGLALQFIYEQLSLFAQQLQPLVLVAQQLVAILAEAFRPPQTPEGENCNGEGGYASQKHHEKQRLSH